MTSVGFEPTPFRTGTLNQRLRPTRPKRLTNFGPKLCMPFMGEAEHVMRYHGTCTQRCIRLCWLINILSRRGNGLHEFFSEIL